MRLPLFVMPRRRLLPACDLTLHLGRPVTFRRFEEAYAAGSEIFVARGDASGVRTVGVVARIVTLSRIPSPRQGGESEDRALLRGVRRASIPSGTELDAKDAEIVRLDENPPRALDEQALAAIARMNAAVEAHRRSRHRVSWRGSAAVDEMSDPIARIYKTATYEETGSWTREALLEASEIRRKAEILDEALQEEIDLRTVETRILGRL